MDINDN